jgi:hypothetical protein
VPDQASQLSRIESLRKLLDRLSSSDLTLADAKILCAEVQRVMSAGEPDRDAPAGGPQPLIVA